MNDAGLCPAPAHDEGGEGTHEGRRGRLRHQALKGNSGDDAGIVDIVGPHFGYRNRISIDRKWGFIRWENGTDAARNDGRKLRTILDST